MPDVDTHLVMKAVARYVALPETDYQVKDVDAPDLL